MNNTLKICPARLLFPLFLMLAPARVFSQDYPDSTLLTVKLHSGDHLVGYVTNKTRDTVFFRNKSVGAVAIPRKNIRIITRAKVKNMGQYWKNAPMEATYFVGPSGFGLKKGQGYYRNYGAYISQFSFGLTDRVSIGMTSLLLPFYFPTVYSMKINFPYHTGNGSVAFAAGVYTGGVIYSDDPGGTKRIPAFLALNTWGTRKRQVTVGIGLSSFNENTRLASLLYSLSYMDRLSGKWAFVSECHVFRADEPFFAPCYFGARFFGRRINFDFGLNANFTPNDYYLGTELGGSEVSLSCFPMFSIAVPWNKKVKPRHSDK